MRKDIRSARAVRVSLEGLQSNLIKIALSLIMALYSHGRCKNSLRAWHPVDCGVEGKSETLVGWRSFSFLFFGFVVRILSSTQREQDTPQQGVVQ